MVIALWQGSQKKDIWKRTRSLTLSIDYFFLEDDRFSQGWSDHSTMLDGLTVWGMPAIGPGIEGLSPSGLSVLVSSGFK